MNKASGDRNSKTGVGKKKASAATDATRLITPRSRKAHPTPEAKKAMNQHERKVRVRKLRPSDFEPVIKLQLACFPGMTTWTREQYDSMLSHFPEGQLCVELEGEVVASSASLVLNFDDYSDWHDWRRVSDYGSIRNHNATGDTMYGIEMMVAPKQRGMKLSRRLYEARKSYVSKHNLARIVIGGRIPGYKHHKNEMSVQEYVNGVLEKSLFDPTLTPQVANGFVLRGIIPDYMPSDEDSAGFATFLEWQNPAHVPESGKRFHLVQNVSVCSVQYQMRPLTGFDDFARQVEFFIDVASDYRSDFVVFPELFTLQLLSYIPTKRPSEAARRLADLTPDYLELFSRLAVRYNVNIIGGSQFTLEGDKLYNTSYLFRRDGTLGMQHKIHITPSERKWWGVAPGERLEVFDTDRGKIAILICYDIEFPELARYAAHKGVRLVFCPFNTDERHGYLRVRLCAQARCIENHVYVVTSGCVGNLPQVANADIHYAQSGIFTPSDLGFARDGIAAECTANIETVVMHNLDLEQVRQHRFTGVTQNWNDRRQDLYKVAFRGKDGEEMI